MRRSIALEDRFWEALESIAGERGIKALVEDLHPDSEQGLVSALRVFALNHYRDRARRR